MKYKRLRGVKDLVSPENDIWTHITEAAFSVFSAYSYSLILTPVIEELELFRRGVGETSDIVIKEMYAFKDKKGRDIVLRPEGTASVVRAYIENSLPEKSDLFYIGPMFRYERPQTGRYREFYQIGVESFGDATPYKDADVICLADALIKKLGIKSYSVRINNIGAKTEYNEELKNFLNGVRTGLCEDCANKIDRAPVRVLDCKKESCISLVKNAPVITDWLDEKGAEHYAALKELLSLAGVDYEEDTKMVRGLDYYTGTVFEFVTDKLGPQQNTILAGGRYDGLVKELGGKDVPATGFALGVERIAEVIKAEGIEVRHSLPEVFIVADREYIKDAYALLSELRKKEISCAMSFEGKSFKAQMREADSRKAGFAVIIGEKEMKEGSATVKNMKSGEQKTVKLIEVSGYIKG